MKHRMMVGLAILAMLVIPAQSASAVTRKLPISKGTTQIGWADVVVDWAISYALESDKCGAGTVSTEAQDYPNVSVYAAAKDKSGNTIQSKSAKGQVRVVLSTPLIQNCNMFYTRHCVGDGVVQYCMSIET